MTERNDGSETSDATEREVLAPASEVDPLVAMDQESTESIRGTFIVLTLVGGLLLLPPRQFVSSAILIVLSVLLAVYHFVKGRRGEPGAQVSRSEEAAK